MPVATAQTVEELQEAKDFALSRYIATGDPVDLVIYRTLAEAQLTATAIHSRDNLAHGESEAKAP
jgi:hypothetical protein